MGAAAERLIEADAIAADDRPFDLTRVAPSMLAYYSSKLEDGEAFAREYIIREVARLKVATDFRDGKSYGVTNHEDAEKALRELYRKLHPGANPATLREPTKAECDATMAIDPQYGPPERRHIPGLARNAALVRDYLTILDADARNAKAAEEASAKRRAESELRRLSDEVETDDAADMRAISDGIVAGNKLAEIMALMRVVLRGEAARKRAMERREKSERAAGIARMPAPKFSVLPETPKDAVMFIRVFNSGSIRAKF